MRVAIIQARTGSTRLPGKILKSLGDYSVIHQVYHRVSQSKMIDRVVIALPDTKNDDALADHVETFCSYVSRGSEDDVLGRYMKAARENDATTVIRITSDCPFIDPDIIDWMLEAYGQRRPDYMTNTKTPFLPRGLDAEVFSFNALLEAFNNAKQRHQREHVTPYIYQNPETYVVEGFQHLKSDNSDLRWTLDTPEDWQLIQKMYSLLEVPFQGARYQDFLSLYDDYPELRQINEAISQKPLESSN